MPYFVKGTNIEIKGTYELMPTCYPITRDELTGEWTYSGGEREVFDEGLEPVKNDAGEPLFFDEDGNERALSEIEWRTEWLEEGDDDPVED